MSRWPKCDGLRVRCVDASRARGAKQVTISRGNFVSHAANMTAMEMKRWAEACEKERRTWLRPAATAQDTTAADTARTLAHTAKLERASAIHLWHVERG